MGLTYNNAQASNGTCTITQPATATVTWNLTSLTVSMAGPTSGVNAKLTIYDGAVGGTVLYAVFLQGPGAAGVGSIGNIQEIPLPRDPYNRPCLQALTGHAMTIQVTGTGVDQVSINARFTDGLP